MQDASQPAVVKTRSLIAALALAAVLALPGCASPAKQAANPAPAPAPTVAVPNVVGMQRTKAAETLAAAGFGVGQSKESYSDSVAIDLIISQAPAAGSGVAPGSSVGLEISAGPEGKAPARKPGSSAKPSSGASGGTAAAPAASDPIARAFANHESGVQVTGQGTVTRVLSDDNDGSRHQRFILRLASGQTLLVAHNIDIAPRVPSLTVGNVISFYGEYEWNAQGGTIHWTHRDPAGQHVAGWLKRDGVTYQ